MNTYKHFLLVKIPAFLVAIVFVATCLLYVLHGHYKGYALWDKLYLLEKTPDVFFAGDSRAHRQLVPARAASLLGKKEDDVVNIAVTGGCITDVSEVVKNNPALFKDAVVIVSLSVMALNDGVLDSTSITDSLMSQMSPVDHVLLLLPEHSSTFFDYYTTIAKYLFRTKKPKRADVATNGYHPVDKALSFSEEWAEGMNNYWFQEWNVRGIKYEIMKKELAFLKAHVGRLYVYSGPYASIVIRTIKSSGLGIDEKKREFDLTLGSICEGLDIPFISYYGQEAFSDCDYYDGVHLNANATSLFTGMVLGDFGLRAGFDQ